MVWSIGVRLVMDIRDPANIELARIAPTNVYLYFKDLFILPPNWVNQ